MSELALFSVAKEALAEARRVDEVLDVRDQAQRMRLYGQQAGDRTVIADASEIISRAERRLGEMLKAAHDAGQISKGGRPGKSNLETGTGEEPVFSVTLDDIGVSKKLSASSQKLASLGETAFEAAMNSARDKIISGGAASVNPLRDVSTEGKKVKRAEREAELGKKQMALPVAKFGVIYADPEWQFETRSEGGMDRSADNHYPTSSFEAIKERDVGSLAADDAVIFLWATVPMLHKALACMTSWGFIYKSHLIWNKDRIGTGYWNRNKHELLLIGTCGDVPAPAMGDQFASVIDAPVGEHSAKPEKFYEIIEAYFPTLPKIELNARQARAGWVRWGYEAPEESQTNASEDDGANVIRESAPDDSVTGDASCAIGRAGPAEPLSTEAADDIIRAGDDARTPLAELAALIGRPGNINYVKNRRRVMKLSSMDRVRESVAASNRRRAAE